MKILSWIITLYFLCINILNAQSFYNISNTSIDEYIKKEMLLTDTKGMAVAIVKNGKIIHQNTYGIANIEFSIPVTNHTNFTIASVTKLITSTLIMKMMDVGRISLEDSLGKLLPEFTQWKSIRVRHLLAHEAGISPSKNIGGYLGGESTDQFKVQSLEEEIKELANTPLQFDLGEKQVYPNGDYFVLQYILEKMYGLPFEDILKQELLLPFKMMDGGFDNESRGFPYQTMLPISNKSQNFTKSKNGLKIFKGFYATSTYAAGGMFASLDDMVKWTTILDEGKLISPNSQEYAIKSQRKEDLYFSDLGWIVKKRNDITTIGHSGGPGLGDIVRIPKDKFTVIVLTNNVDLSPYLAEEILKMFYPNLILENTPKTFDRNL